MLGATVVGVIRALFERAISPRPGLLTRHLRAP